MLGWFYRWQERRITRAWAAEIAGDREYLERYFDYEDAGNGVTVMTPKVQPQDSAGGDYAS